MAPRKQNLLSRRTASVTLHRNGLQIEIPNVPATDAALVAGALLSAMRELTRAYPELIADAGSYHAQPLETPDETDGPDFTDPPSAARQIGFHITHK